MELLILALAIAAIEEARLYLDRKKSKKLVEKYERLMQEYQAVESQVANEWVVRSRYELECQ